MQKYLVTGGAGFIGSHLVDELIKQNNKVAVIDNLSTGKKENLNPQANFYNIDICDSKISEIFEKENPDAVFHYAAQISVRKSVENPIESAKTNILGSLNILENCRNFGVKKIIFASSGGAIYGETKIIPASEDCDPQPVSPYGVEKLIIEYYLNFYKKEYGLDYLILRFANIYGPRQNPIGEAGVVAIFCAKLLSSQQPVINGDGKQTRDFVFVEDAVRANILGIEKKESGVFNIGTMQETDINAIFEKLNKIFGLKNQEIHMQEKPGEQKRSCLNFKKAENMLGWQPKISIDEGLNKTMKWFQDNGKLKIT